MSESDWFLIAVMVWFICTTASIAGCSAEPDKWSNISMCAFAFFITTGIIACFMMSTLTW